MTDVVREVSLVVPLQVPWPRESHLVKRWSDFLEELGELSPLGVSFGCREIDLSLRVVERGGADDTWSSVAVTGIGVARDYVFLEVTGSATIDLARAAEVLGPDSSRRAREAFEFSFLQADTERFVGDLCMAASLAEPGIFHSGESYLRAAGEPFGQSIPGSAVNAGALWEYRSDDSDPAHWPLLKSLPLRTTWKWIAGVPGYLEGVPSGSTGRALAALSEIIWGSRSAHIFYALLGLESLYCDSSVGLRKQLIRKARLVLGEPSAHKKTLGRAYDFRSRYIHGDLDIPLAYTPYDATEGYSQFASEETASAAVAVRTLVATLQEMVERQLYSLRFEYVWPDS